jgi:hypothetical protein
MTPSIPRRPRISHASQILEDDSTDMPMTMMWCDAAVLSAVVRIIAAFFTFSFLFLNFLFVSDQTGTRRRDIRDPDLKQ